MTDGMETEAKPESIWRYFDQAATSRPKPKAVLEAMIRYQREICASPGRSGHRLSVEAGRIVFHARDALAELFGVADPLRIALTKNATEALNIVIQGFLKPGDHVVTSGMEHNSVMRPLRAREREGVGLTVVTASPEGLLDPDDVRRALRPETRLLLVTHASNVTGTIQPVAELAALSRETGIPLCLDAAQSAGVLPLAAEEGIDLIAFTGHKSLFGPQGTGGLYLREGLEKEIRPLLRGGTGSRSESEEQPSFLPDLYESGTPNTVGVAGLEAGVRFVLSAGLDQIRRREEGLTRRFLAGLRNLEGVTVFGPKEAERRTAVVSVRLRRLSPSAAALALDERFGILCRPGLHCAPAAHRTLGTFPEGTLRFSFGYFHTEDDIDEAVRALEELR